MKRLIFAMFLVVALGFPGLAHATLVNNGGGLIYDTDLNITWYDFEAAGRDWQEAKDWAADLEITVNGTKYSDWRLPTSLNQDDSGPTDGYNVTGSEMGHLYYTELGNKGYYDVNGHYQPDYGLVNKGPFTNLIGFAYWSNEVGNDPSYDGGAWYFMFNGGRQSIIYDDQHYYPLAVHEGNVGAPVPIPTAVWLFGTGLLGLFGVRRKIRK
jgi:hypothetical protein